MNYGGFVMRGQWAIGVALLMAALAGVSAAQEIPLPTQDDYFTGGGQEASPSDRVIQSPVQGDKVADDFSDCFQACQFPCVYFQADALYWDRVGTGCNNVLVIDTDDGSTLLSTDDLSFNAAMGMRFLIGWQPHHCCHCCAWELSYWGLYNWNSDAIINGTGDLAIPGDLGLASNNFFLADTIDVDYRTELHNVELNCIKSCCTGCAKIDFIAGFRYLALNDSLLLTATDAQESTSSYDLDVHNDLYGLQLGGRYTRPLCCCWGVELTGKAGLFYNDVSTNQLVTDFPDTPSAFVLRDATGSRDGVAMLGEIGIVLIRPINECWNFRVGYSALGLGGVALATDQLDFTDTQASGTEIHNTGWIFAHGGLIGLERRW
jgi:putative beta barrel porin BBP7